VFEFRGEGEAVVEVNVDIFIKADYFEVVEFVRIKFDGSVAGCVDVCTGVGKGGTILFNKN
jgi:hypothetical protein